MAENTANISGNIVRMVSGKPFNVPGKVRIIFLVDGTRPLDPMDPQIEVVLQRFENLNIIDDVQKAFVLRHLDYWRTKVDAPEGKFEFIDVPTFSDIVYAFVCETDIGNFYSHKSEGDWRKTIRGEDLLTKSVDDVVINIPAYARGANQPTGKPTRKSTGGSTPTGRTMESAGNVVNLGLTPQGEEALAQMREAAAEEGDGRIGPYIWVWWAFKTPEAFEELQRNKGYPSEVGQASRARIEETMQKDPDALVGNVKNVGKDVGYFLGMTGITDLDVPFGAPKPNFNRAILKEYPVVALGGARIFQWELIRQNAKRWREFNTASDYGARQIEHYEWKWVRLIEEGQEATTGKITGKVVKAEMLPAGKTKLNAAEAESTFNNVNNGLKAKITVYDNDTNEAIQGFAGIDIGDDGKFSLPDLPLNRPLRIDAKTSVDGRKTGNFTCLGVYPPERPIRLESSSPTFEFAIIPIPTKDDSNVQTTVRIVPSHHPRASIERKIPLRGNRRGQFGTPHALKIKPDSDAENTEKAFKFVGPSGQRVVPYTFFYDPERNEDVTGEWITGTQKVRIGGRGSTTVDYQNSTAVPVSQETKIINPLFNIPSSLKSGKKIYLFCVLLKQDERWGHDLFLTVIDAAFAETGAEKERAARELEGHAHDFDFIEIITKKSEEAEEAEEKTAKELFKDLDKLKDYLIKVDDPESDTFHWMYKDETDMEEHETKALEQIQGLLERLKRFSSVIAEPSDLSEDHATELQRKLRSLEANISTFRKTVQEIHERDERFKDVKVEVVYNKPLRTIIEMADSFKAYYESNRVKE